MGKDRSQLLNENLERVLEAAQAHGEEDDPEHEIGDLQGVIHAMWSVLTDDQKETVLAHDDVRDVLETWGTL